MTRELFSQEVTRRTFLSSGLACAAAWIIPPWLLAEAVPSAGSVAPSSHQAAVKAESNLYVFPGPQPETTAIAVTWWASKSEGGRDRISESQVRIHAGSKTWNFRVESQAAVSNVGFDDVTAVYVGEILIPEKVQDRVAKAVVMSAPNRATTHNGSTGFWAELLESGSRVRVGTPFLSSLVADCDQLAHLYHACSPAEDRRLLMRPLARAIAMRARARGQVADPEAHGRRLAATLLPDVLYYDPKLPSGYTFASRNGRHPAESLVELVNTVVEGRPFSNVSGTTCRLERQFPYFQRTAA